MKVLLIYPPFKQQEIYSDLYKSESILPPMGLAYIASYLIAQGHGVKLWDSVALSLNLKDIKDIIKVEKPDIVGATANSPIYYHALKLMQLIKEISPDTSTVLGGYHPTMFPRDVLSNCCVDYVVIGEGELTMAELCSTIEQKREQDSVLGLGFKRDGKIIINKARPFISDLDILPYPAYRLLPMEKYHVPTCFSKYSRQISIISSRGCPGNCYFCTSPGFWRRIVRFHSPEYIIGNINYGYENFGIKSFQFRDDNFTTSKQRVIDFCKLALKNKYKFEWDCYSRFDYFDEEMIRLMKEAGCYQISLGVETGSDRMLKKYKNLNKSTIVNQMRILKKIKIKTRLFFIIGPPAQSIDEIEETIDFAIHLNPDIFVATISVPYPGSRYYDDMYMKGFATDFSNQSARVYKSPCDLLNFKKQQLDELLRACYKRFYLRPSYVLNRAFSISSFTEFKRYLINSYSLLKLVFNGVSE